MQRNITCRNVSILRCANTYVKILRNVSYLRLLRLLRNK